MPPADDTPHVYGAFSEFAAGFDAGFDLGCDLAARRVSCCAAYDPGWGVWAGRPVSPVAVVRVAGGPDPLVVPMLRECVRAQLAAGSVSLLLDLSRATLTGSPGLGALLGYCRQLAHGVHVGLPWLSGAARRMAARWVVSWWVVSWPLELTGAAGVFNFAWRPFEALAEPQPGSGRVQAVPAGEVWV